MRIQRRVQCGVSHCQKGQCAILLFLLTAPIWHARKPFDSQRLVAVDGVPGNRAKALRFLTVSRYFAPLVSAERIRFFEG
jgi:hypothetical protein